MTEALGATNLRDLDYDYSTRDNITAINDLLAPQNDRAMSYDARNMLSGATGPYGAVAFGYDAVGNRISAPGAITGTSAAEVIIGTAGADVISPNGGHGDDVTGGGGADLFDFTSSAANGVSDFTVIRDYGPDDALNFGGAPIAYVTGGDTSITIVIDTVARDVVRIEAPGGLTFNDIRIRPVPLGLGSSGDVYTYGPTSNRLSQVQFVSGDTRTFSYDAAGSTTGDVRTVGMGVDDWGYAYNDQNRLASVTLNTVEQATYRYNFAGHQVVRSVWDGGVLAKTISVHDIAGQRLGEYDGATGTLLREYLWLGDRPLAVLEGGQLYHLHLNQVGRPDMATDAAGTVVWQASFYPFGGIHQVTIDTGALTQNLRFPGQWFQAETGFHQNWHRDYDPTLGRYLQADPLGLVDGPSVYGYAGQTPVINIDPLGLQELPAQNFNPNGRLPGNWTFYPDSNNSRGGTWQDGNGNSASWDGPGDHWDVDDGKGNRRRYNRHGKEISKEEAHTPRKEQKGPRRWPFPPKGCVWCWLFNPNLIPSPGCFVNPKLCEEIACGPEYYYDVVMSNLKR